MEPYAPPGSEPGTGFDLGQVVIDTLSAVARNLGPLLGAAVVLTVLYLASAFTCCIGGIFALPIATWGTYRFSVQMADGRASPSVFWADLPPYGPLFLRMWGTTLVLALITSPLVGVGVASALLQEQIGVIERNALSFVITTVYTLLIVRFQLAPLLVVDRGAPVLEAFGRSWEATGPRWGALIVLQLLMSLLGAPIQVLTIGMQMLQERTEDDPQAALEVLPAMLGLYGGLLVLGGIAGAVGLALFGVVYRRLFGRT